MKITKNLLQAGVLGMSLLATGVMAAVSESEAAKLGTSLTPMGAEKAGNAANTIPAWSPMPKNAGAVDSKGFLANPYASEKPLFIITAANVEQYKDKLAPGQYAMFKRYPDSYRIPVYPTHRGATVPDDVFAAIKKNATTTKLVGGGSGLENFDTAIPFPSRPVASRSSGTTSPATGAAASSVWSPRPRHSRMAPTAWCISPISSCFATR